MTLTAQNHFSHFATTRNQDRTKNKIHLIQFISWINYKRRMSFSRLHYTAYLINLSGWHLSRDVILFKSDLKKNTIVNVRKFSNLMIAISNVKICDKYLPFIVISHFLWLGCTSFQARYFNNQRSSKNFNW